MSTVQIKNKNVIRILKKHIKCAIISDFLQIDT